MADQVKEEYVGFGLIALALTVAAPGAVLVNFPVAMAVAVVLVIAAAGFGMVALNEATSTRGARAATWIGVGAATVATVFVLADALNATPREVDLQSAVSETWLWAVAMIVFGTTFMAARGFTAAVAAFFSRSWKPGADVALAAIAALGIAALDVLLLVALERVL